MFCRRHLAQLRRDYPEFQKRNAELIAIGTASPIQFQRFWRKESMPFPGLSDQTRQVLKQYGQEFKWHKFGRMPALFIIDTNGVARWMYYGAAASDFPDNADVLAALDELQSTSG